MGRKRESTMKKIINKVQEINSSIRSYNYRKRLAQEVKSCEREKAMAKKMLEFAEKHFSNNTKLIEELKFNLKMKESLMVADIALFR